MKKINKKATAIFKQLINGMNTPGEYRKIENSETYMPVHINLINKNQHGKIISISHTFVQNGDLMYDPDMTFLVSIVDHNIYPLTFRQDPMIHQEAAYFQGKHLMINKRLQSQLATFAGKWMENIKRQQRL